jgi:hypothetical protein
MGLRGYCGSQFCQWPHVSAWHKEVRTECREVRAEHHPACSRAKGVLSTGRAQRLQAAQEECTVKVEHEELVCWGRVHC